MPGFVKQSLDGQGVGAAAEPTSRQEGDKAPGEKQAPFELLPIVGSLSFEPTRKLEGRGGHRR